MTTKELPVLLNPSQAAHLLGGVTSATLAVWRYKKKRDLKWHKIGRRVFYKESEILDFIARHEVDPAATQA